MAPDSVIDGFRPPLDRGVAGGKALAGRAARTPHSTYRHGVTLHDSTKRVIQAGPLKLYDTPRRIHGVLRADASGRRAGQGKPVASGGVLHVLPGPRGPSAVRRNPSRDSLLLFVGSFLCARR